MQFTNEALWNELAQDYTDNYGQSIMTIAQKWAELMEPELDNGTAIETIADDMFKKANKGMGVTGYMYGQAVTILAEVWKYGKELRAWNNIDLDPKHGQEATDQNQTINPALWIIHVNDDLLPPSGN